MRSKHFIAVLLSALLLMTMSVAAFAQRATREPLERTEIGNIVIEPIITQNDSPLREPIALDFAVDGTIFFIERQGYVNQLDPYTGERIELLELDVFLSKPGGEREMGLMGIALEPGFNFKDKNNIWLYYSPNPENNVMNRLSRFEYKIGEDGVPYIDPDSEEIIFMVYWDRDWCCHPAGDIRFGPDGTLYLSLGDDVDPNGTHNGYAGLDTRPGNERSNNLRTSQSATDLRGKILRLNPDGTIPMDNPYYSDSRYHPAVYAIGFRNPYRIHIDPVTGWVLYGDNNPDARVVDPNRGPAGISEWGVVTEPGQNHGWPLCVGANEPYMNYDYWTGTNHGPFDCSTFTPAYVWQEYTQMWQFPQLGQGGSSPIAGVILRRPAEDAKYQWSEEYLNHWYPADFTRGFIARFELYADGTRLPEPSNWYDYNLQAPRDYHQVPPPNGEIEVWLPLFAGPIDLRQSPDGALYLVDYGRSFFRANPEAAIYRIYDKAATEGQKETVPLAVQVYALSGSLEERLAIAAAAGYKGVELTGTHNMSAEELKALLDKYNLVVASNHWRDWNDLKAAAEFNLAIGNTRIVNPMERADSAEGWREIGRRLNAIGAELREYGISFGYHNHAHEFEIYDGKYAIEYLFEETDPENVHFQIDLGWAYNAGVDLLELIDKYAGRIESVHVKDWSGDTQVSVGHGDISWPAIISKLNTVGGTKWYITEQDRPPNATLFAYESAAFLNPLLARILDKAEHEAPFGDLPTAVQLYAIRQAGDFEDRLALAADAGYNAVELWGWGNLSGSEVRALLDKYGLDATSTHTGANSLRNNMEATIQFHKDVGVDRLIIPSFNANDAEGWANFGKELNAWGAELREHGILLGYHNHGQEFQVYDGRWALEWMLDEVDPENLFLQVDLGWAYDAGVDLIDFINKYEGRILSVHVKDWNEDGSSQVSVGKGVIDWVEVLQAAYEIGGTEWFITEQDGPPSYRVFAYESAVGLSAALNEIMQ